MLTAAPALAGPNQGRVSFSVGNDFTTAYFFRGILQERNGFIWQPYGEINVSLYSTDDETDPMRGFGLFVGSWNSIQTKKTLTTDSGPSNWYESDVYAGAKFSLFGNSELKAFYIAYTYPNGAFNTVQEFDVSYALNDSGWMGKWALNPSLLVAGEMDNTAAGTEKGTYLEVGLRPSFTIIESETYPVSLAVPIKLGLSLGDYFEDPAGDDDTFGYVQSGLVFSVPLAFIPAEYGSWSASAGASVYTFGNNLKDYNQGDDPWVVGTWSLNFSY